jgi:hypothetical protein
MKIDASFAGAIGLALAGPLSTIEQSARHGCGFINAITQDMRDRQVWPSNVRTLDDATQQRIHQIQKAIRQLDAVLADARIIGLREA